jgi:hypothetical protein
MKNKIQLFKESKIRTHWNADEEKWYFSIIDVIEVLIGNNRARKYWSDLKKKLKLEGSELSEKIGQLKMLAPDGKMRKTDVADKKENYANGVKYISLGPANPNQFYSHEKLIVYPLDFMHLINIFIDFNSCIPFHII